MLFSKYTWSLRMTASVSKMSKFGFALKIGIKTCIICIDQVHDHVDLDVHLDHQDSLEHPQNHKVRIFHEKLGYLPCIVPVLLELRVSYILLVIMGFLMTKCSCLLKKTSKLSKNPKFGFCLKNWPINMCIVFLVQNFNFLSFISKHQTFYLKHHISVVPGLL